MQLLSYHDDYCLPQHCDIIITYCNINHTKNTIAPKGCDSGPFLLFIILYFVDIFDVFPIIALLWTIA